MSFDACVRNGGSVRRINGPNDKYNLKEGEFVEVCTRAGEKFRSDVRKDDDAALTSLKLTDKEREYDGPALVSQGENMGPEFPYGLHVNLGNESLDKLGLDIGKFKAGSDMYAVVKLHIIDKQVSEREREGGEKYVDRNLSVIITHMKVVEGENG